MACTDQDFTDIVAQTGGKFAKASGGAPVTETIADAKGFFRTVITAADN